MTGHRASAFYSFSKWATTSVMSRRQNMKTIGRDGSRPKPFINRDGSRPKPFINSDHIVCCKVLSTRINSAIDSSSSPLFALRSVTYRY